ncbi:MAG: YeeE/YedE family protein [Simkaniaceae bacterium]|nr:YeeE/YedE family protein [Simkaniaceae bacterium]
MSIHFFSNPILSLTALLTGMVFGFYLRKARVANAQVIINQLILKDFTVMKVILTAILVGSLGIYSLNAIGMIPTFHFSKTPILFSLIGGGFFGVGMALLGLCPGTLLAALAEGSKKIIVGFAGMLVGAAIFNELSVFISSKMNEKDAVYQLSMMDYFHVPFFIVFAAFATIYVAFVLLTKGIEHKKKQSRV